ncbi:YwiC-like family protein [Bacillus massiliigorillae]|uniref:YwiC-like family protein n=1 Tax=Bacillus massiliigorillae TaxID=1243664 RepID=UPI0005A892ED|nr:YwiC-like family protein [Bacillus massiliigorillae]
MKLLIPKQHGAWAMLVIPFVLSMVAGGSTVWHIFLFMGWFFLYLTTYSFVMFLKGKKKEYYKKWVMIYALAAILFLVPVGIYCMRLIYFGIAMIPFFCINLYYAKKKNERAFLNDVAAIFTFCIGGLASYYLGANELHNDAWTVFIYSFLYFLGCTLYVKTMIREKNNVTYKYYSWIYHFIMLFIVALIGPVWIVIAYLPSVLRAWILYGRKLSVMKIGIIEICNSVFFFCILVFSI